MWFLTREEADHRLEEIEKIPEYIYEVKANGCGPGWGVQVHDSDGNLIDEAA